MLKCKKLQSLHLFLKVKACLKVESGIDKEFLLYFVGKMHLGANICKFLDYLDILVFCRMMGLGDGEEMLLHTLSSFALNRKFCAGNMQGKLAKLCVIGRNQGISLQGCCFPCDRCCFPQSHCHHSKWLPPCIDLSLQQFPEKCSFHCLKQLIFFSLDSFRKLWAIGSKLASNF